LYEFTNFSEVYTASIIRAFIVLEVCTASVICVIVALMMEAEPTTEKLVNSYKSTQRYNPKDNHLNISAFGHVQPLCYDADV
jgi:hypothetical protein